MKHGELKRTLGTGDLVFAHVLVIVGLNMLGPAARLGAKHWMYWLLAIALYQVPLAMVVMHLVKMLPREGGPYQWARAAFNDFTGFMVAWNMCCFVVVFGSTLGLSVAAGIGYAAGADEAWLSNPAWQIGISALTTSAIAGLSIAGFGTSKWLHNLAAITLLGAIALLIVLPLMQGRVRVPAPAGNGLSLLELVLFTRIAVYALSGFECMSLVVEEVRGGARSMTRSIAIAVPCIAAAYILGTQSLLSFGAPAEIDLVNPVAQAFANAFRPYGRVAAIAAVASILLLVGRDFAQLSQGFAAVSRLPMVAGWDDLVPAWFTRLHPRTKTPVNAILLGGAVMIAASIAAVVAAGRQEAFQMLLGTGSALFGLMYLVIFAIPLLARLGPTPWWLRIAAGSGLAITITFIALMFIPIVEVASRRRYGAILACAVVGVNIVGATLFARFRNAASRTSVRGHPSAGHAADTSTP